jgi:hypothetical protein
VEWGERLGFKKSLPNSPVKPVEVKPIIKREPVKESSISKVSDIFVINSREGCDPACPYVGDKEKPCRKEQATHCECKNPTMGRAIGDSFGICEHCSHIVIRHRSEIFHYYRSYSCGFPYYGKACCAPSK